MTHIIKCYSSQFYILGKEIKMKKEKQNDQRTEEKHGKNGLVGGTGGRTWCYLKSMKEIKIISIREIFFF